MDNFNNPNTLLAFTFLVLLLLLNAEHVLQLPVLPQVDEDEEDQLLSLSQSEERPIHDATSFMRTAVQNFRLISAVNVFDDEINYWVKPRSTTWFSHFLLQQYDNSRWVSIFRMTKPAVFALAAVIGPHIEKKNTTYRLAIPVLVRVACTLFKLTHGANFTICSEMFAIGRSTVCKILREVVNAINDCLRSEISWPTGERLRETQAKFSNLCSLPAVIGAIDGTQISIAKPRFGAADYFYFKSGGYSMNCQAVVDSEKRFLDLYVGMPGSTNDSRMLRRSSLYELASHGHLFDATQAVDGFTPYILGDLGYPLLPWLMVSHKEDGHLSVSETLLNKKLRKGRCVVENAFEILKQSFRELLVKSELQLTFLPDVIVCCAILHNILLRQSHDQVEEFLQVLYREGLQSDADAEGAPRREGQVRCREELPPRQDQPSVQAVQKRSNLGLYVTTRRRGGL